MDHRGRERCRPQGGMRPVRTTRIARSPGRDPPPSPTASLRGDSGSRPRRYRPSLEGLEGRLTLTASPSGLTADVVKSSTSLVGLTQAAGNEPMGVSLQWSEYSISMKLTEYPELYESGATLSDLKGTIEWGDGHSEAFGEVITDAEASDDANPDGGTTVSYGPFSHTYAAAGSFLVTFSGSYDVTLAKNAGPVVNTDPVTFQFDFTWGVTITGRTSGGWSGNSDASSLIPVPEGSTSKGQAYGHPATPWPTPNSLRTSPLIPLPTSSGQRVPASVDGVLSDPA